jgi:hypothetical protein
MASIDEKRSFVAAMYPGKGWKRKVRHMSDIQVTAIYLRQKAKADRPQPTKKEKNENDDIPF